MDYNSFITGSQVYGTPTEVSDIDLVVLLSEVDCYLIWGNTEQYLSPRFGKINLIVLNKDCEEDVEQYNIWKKCTEYLASIKPVTREFAVQYFKDNGIKSYQ